MTEDNRLHDKNPELWMRAVGVAALVQDSIESTDDLDLRLLFIQKVEERLRKLRREINELRS